MEGQTKPDRPRQGSGRWLLIAAMVVVLLLWGLGGLLPGALALRRAYLEARREGKPLDWNARLGTFGDSFAGAGSLIASLGLLAVAYQIHLDREQRKDDEQAQDGLKKHQAELAMVTALIQARIYLTSDSNEKLSQLIMGRRVTPSSPADQENRIKREKSEWSWGVHNIQELRRLIERAEHLISWKSSPFVNPDNLIFKDPADRFDWGGHRSDHPPESAP